MERLLIMKERSIYKFRKQLEITILLIALLAFTYGCYKVEFTADNELLFSDRISFSEEIDKSEIIYFSEGDLEKNQENPEKEIKSLLYFSGEIEDAPYNNENFLSGIAHIEEVYSEDISWKILDDQYNLMAIHSFLKAYAITEKKEYLESAEKIARYFNDKKENVWLNNDTKDFNEQLYAAILWDALFNASGKDEYKKIGNEFLNTLLDNITLYDCKISIRQDLGQTDELLFRFVNPYFSEQLYRLKVDEIALCNNSNGEKISIDIGNNEEGMSIDGKWGADEFLEGRSVRSLSLGAEFRFEFPTSWSETDNYELEICYYDEEMANIDIEIQSKVMEDGFKPIKDGSLLISGAEEWRNWRIPISFSEIGDEMSGRELELAACLLSICATDYNNTDALKWADIIRGYSNIWIDNDVEVVELEPMTYPVQTAPLAWQIKDGLLGQRLAGEETVMINGKWDGKSPAGAFTINPYFMACQAKGSYLTQEDPVERYGLTSNEYDGLPWANDENLKKLEKEPALNWLNENAKQIAEGVYVWETDTGNAYNDIATPAPWASAFFQRHVIEAYLENDYDEMAVFAANAFGYSIEDGGLSATYWKNGDIWYEEVPQKSHILNAHLASVFALNKVWDVSQNEDIKKLFDLGVMSLQNHISEYDVGYWSIYDKNPQKELLYQIDWIEGMGQSLLIDEISLVNTQTNTSTVIDVGGEGDFTDYPYISGTDWGG